MQPHKDLTIDCFVDADFAGLWNKEDNVDPTCAKSRTGYCILLQNCLLTWSSKLQQETALSTAESETIALSTALRDLIHIRRLVEEMYTAAKIKTKAQTIMMSKVFEDNAACLKQATSPYMSFWSRHYATKVWHFKEHVGKTIDILKVDSDANRADCFTKVLTREPFEKARLMIMGW